MREPRRLAPILLTVVVLALGCGKASDRGPGNQQAPGGQAAKGQPAAVNAAPSGAPAVEVVTSLDTEFAAEVPRSTSGDQVTTPWLEPPAEPIAPTGKPPADQPGKPGAAPPTGPSPQQAPGQVAQQAQGQPSPQEQAQAQAAPPPAKSAKPWQWLQPSVIIGRTQVFAAGKPVAKVLCTAEQPALCEPAALRGPTGKQALDLDPAELDANHQLTPLAAVVKESAWKDKDVLVMADRRVSWAALDRVMVTLSAAGARPVLIAATYAGQLARVMPAPGATANAPTTDKPAPADLAAGGESKATQPVPDDLAGVLVGVTAHGMSLTLQRKVGEPAQPELLGNVLEALAAWAERLRAAAPALTTATVSIEPQAPVEEVVRAIDALRDTCARSAKGTPCRDRRVLYPRIELKLASATPEPAKADAPAADPAAQVEPALLLDHPSLQIAEPHSGGLHLQGGALDRDVQLRHVPPNLATPLQFRPADTGGGKPSRP